MNPDSTPEPRPGDPGSVTAPVRILCVDDSFYIAEALRLLIDDEPGLSVVGVLGSAGELERAVAELRPDLVLLDLSMDGQPPLEALEQARRVRPGLRSIVYTGLDDRATVERVLRAGVEAFVSKRHPIDEVIAAVREVAAGKRPRPRC